MLFFSVVFLLFLFYLVLNTSVKTLVSEFGFVSSKVRVFVFCFLMFQIFSGIIFRLYLPHVPDNLMFTEIIQTRSLNISHSGNLDLLGFLFYSFPISLLLQGNDFLYLVFQKILISFSVIYLFIGFSKLFFIEYVRFNSLLIFVFFIVFYPSFFVHYNNILRESYELFFFSFFIYYLSVYRYFLAFIFAILLVTVRVDSLVYVPFLLLYVSFKSKFLSSTKSDQLILCVVFLYFTFLISPYCYDYFIQLRADKFTFFSNLNVPESTLFKSFAGVEYLEFYKFYSYSLLQYIFDPISIISFSGTFFMWAEAFFSVTMLLLLLTVIFVKKSINRIILVCLCVIFLQSCVEYFIQGGMRHRLIPYLVILVFISNILVSKKLNDSC
tara:strand:- start:8544 stop:9689 length:1146 start_codon:yes stop_codon:yes gene_type:complete